MLSLTNSDEKIKEMGKAQYLTYKMNNMNADSLLIKLADRLDNTQDGANFKKNNKAFFQNNERYEQWCIKYSKQTKSILDNLKNKCINNNHEELIDLIEDNIGVFL